MTKVSVGPKLWYLTVPIRTCIMCVLGSGVKEGHVGNGRRVQHRCMTAGQQRQHLSMCAGHTQPPVYSTVWYGKCTCNSLARSEAWSARPSHQRCAAALASPVRVGAVLPEPHAQISSAASRGAAAGCSSPRTTTSPATGPRCASCRRAPPPTSHVAPRAAALGTAPPARAGLQSTAQSASSPSSSSHSPSPSPVTRACVSVLLLRPCGGNWDSNRAEASMQWSSV